jgi:hypothetical protein
MIPVPTKDGRRIQRLLSGLIRLLKLLGMNARFASDVYTGAADREPASVPFTVAANG